MAIHYLDSGQRVRRNHILNPDFAIDATHWTPTNANTTISVVEGAQFIGGKALKVEGSVGGSYGVNYTGPSILAGDVYGGPTGFFCLVVRSSSPNPNTPCVLGASLLDGQGNVTGGGWKFGMYSAEPRWQYMPVGSYISGGISADKYVQPQIRFEGSGARVGYIDAVMVTNYYVDVSGDVGIKRYPEFISGNRADGIDGMEYEWLGEPNNSISTGTAMRWADIPETAAIGEPCTVTGGGCIPGEAIRVHVDPEFADDSFYTTNALPDGTFSLTFTMPVHTEGTGTKLWIKGPNVYGNEPFAVQNVSIPAPPPLPVPENTATQVVNYFLNPRLDYSEGTTILAKNYFHNPSPVDSLEGFIPTSRPLTLTAGTSVERTTSSTSTSVTLPTGLTLGDYTIIVASFTSTTTVGSINTPAGWTNILASTSSTAGPTSAVAIFYRKWVTGDTNPNITTTTTGRLAATPIRVRGADPSAFVGVAATVTQATAGATTITAPAITPTGSMLVSVFNGRSATNNQFLTPFTALSASMTKLAEASSKATTATNSGHLIATETVAIGVDTGTRQANPNVATTGAMGVSFALNVPAPAGALTATVELDPTSSIKGQGGVKVTSPHVTTGIGVQTLHQAFPQWVDDDPTFSVYIRAREAMTITAHVESPWIVSTFGSWGWGDYGWGEPYSYVQGWTHTFAAGEVKRFRIMPNLVGSTSGGTWNGSADPGYTFKFTGAGVFDVDGVWEGGGVDDGVDPDPEYGFPQGVDSIPNAPLFFSGDTPDTEDFIYEWEGAPRQSISIKKGHTPKYFRSGGFYTDPDMEGTFTTSLPDGEKVAGAQSSWDESSVDFNYLTSDGPADGVGEDLRRIGLVEGKSYAVSFDLISVMENYIEGYLGGGVGWAQFYLEVGDAYIGLPAYHPFRKRFTMPVTVGASPIEAIISTYRNWYTGYHAVARVAINEIPLHINDQTSVSNVPGTIDLLALGAVAGSSYGVIMDEVLGVATDYLRAEYQAGGDWITMGESLYDLAKVDGDTTDFEFTIPADATAARITYWIANSRPYFDIFTMPVPFFDGDTPDGDGYTYQWFGEPGNSSSIRIEGGAPTPTPYEEARAYVGGSLVAVQEIRVMTGGQLLPVSDFRRP